MDNIEISTILNNVLRKVKILKINMSSLPINRDTSAMINQIQEIDDIVVTELRKLTHNEVA